MLVIIEPDLGIESSQKFTFHHRTSQLIKPTRVSQKIEIGQHDIGFTTQLFIGALQLLPNHGSTRLKITKPFAQLLTNQPTIRSQIQQPFLLDIQPAQFLLQPPLGFPLRGLLMLQAICHPLPQRCNLLDGDAQCGNLTRQGVLNVLDWQVRQTTTSTVGAGVVLIRLTSTVDRLRIDQLTISS
ncbi:MAG: hypothetical protein ACFN22_03885, partial [Porphyromonas pasteri]